MAVAEAAGLGRAWAAAEHGNEDGSGGEKRGFECGLHGSLSGCEKDAPRWLRRVFVERGPVAVVHGSARALLRSGTGETWRLFPEYRQRRGNAR